LNTALINFERSIDLLGERELNGMITDMFKKVGEAIKYINTSRKSYVDLLELKVLPSLNWQISTLKERKTEL